jgi:hypothetical protein
MAGQERETNLFFEDLEINVGEGIDLKVFFTDEGDNNAGDDESILESLMLMALMSLVGDLSGVSPCPLGFTRFSRQDGNLAGSPDPLDCRLASNISRTDFSKTCCRSARIADPTLKPSLE